MSLQQLIGDVRSSVGSKIKSFLDSAWSAVNGVADNVGTFVGNIWSGGFAGLSNFDELKSAVNTYSQNVKDIVDQYETDADIDSAFKGEAAAALKEDFIPATKSLLDAYVALVEKWNDELDDIYNKYTGADGGGDKALASNVSSDAEMVKNAAQNVSIG